MKPIGLRRDNVVLAVHTSANGFRSSSRTELGRTLANPSGTGWPLCWVCSEQARANQRQNVHASNFGDAVNVPVEGYVEHDRARTPRGDMLVTLRAECSHGKGAGGRVYEDVKTFTFPRAWSETKWATRRSPWVVLQPMTLVPSPPSGPPTPC